MAKRADDIESDVDALFQLPPSEFTAARNALAARLKKEGRAEEAAAVKALARPPMSAWTVNQLPRRHRKALEALLDAGERFRAAQAAQLAGKPGDLRRLLDERRQALTEVTARAHEILRESGHAVSPDISRRIATTLEALAAYGRAPGAPAAGRLRDDLDPPGFEALAALVPRAGGSPKGAEPTRVLPFRPERAGRAAARKDAEDEAARRAKAREAVREAESALREAQRTAAAAEAALKKAAARAKAAQKDKDDLEKRLEKAQSEAQEAAKEARRVAEEAEEAAQAVTDAERELEKARSALAALE